jgi:hypothetical protein
MSQQIDLTCTAGSLIQPRVQLVETVRGPLRVINF